jgi:MFS transporter, PPP family, 3-phenylpropionic acid transporter
MLPTSAFDPNRNHDPEHFPSFATRLAFYYGALFIGFGTALPYFNVWLASRGLSLDEIALVAAAAPVVRMLGIIAISVLADRANAHRTFVICLGWGHLGAWLLMAQSKQFSSILLAQILVSLTGAALMPLVETLAIGGVRARGLDYGSMRLWGSASFIGSSLLGGWLLDWRGPEMIISLIIAGVATLAVSGHGLPRPEPQTATTRRPLRLADAFALARTPEFLLFLLAAGAVQGAHATLYVFSVLHWSAQGISNGWCGALWAIGVIAEIAVFWWAGRITRGWSPVLIMAVGAAASIVRWSMMALDPPLAVLVPLQMLHGLTYAASHIGAIQFLARAVPVEQAGTGQGLYALVTGGVAMAVATQIAGASYQISGGRAYLWMAAIALVSLIAAGLLHRRWTPTTPTSPSHSA